MKTALLLFSLLLLTACSQLRDLPHLAAGQWQLLHERQAVPDLLADPAQPAALKARLREAALARDFASCAMSAPPLRAWSVARRDVKGGRFAAGGQK